MFGFLGKAFNGVADQVQAYLPSVTQEAWSASKAITGLTYYGVTTYGPPVASAAWSASNAIAKFSLDQATTYGPPVAGAAWSAAKAVAKFSLDQVTTYGPPAASAAWSASTVAAQASYEHVTTYGPPAVSATWDMSKMVFGAVAHAAKKVVDAVTAEVASLLHPVVRSKGELVEWQPQGQAKPGDDDWQLVDVVETLNTADTSVPLDPHGNCIKHVGEHGDDCTFSKVSVVGWAEPANFVLHAQVAP